MFDLETRCDELDSSLFLGWDDHIYLFGIRDIIILLLKEWATCQREKKIGWNGLSVFEGPCQFLSDHVNPGLRGIFLTILSHMSPNQIHLKKGSTQPDPSQPFNQTQLYCLTRQCRVIRMEDMNHRVPLGWLQSGRWL